MYYLFFDIECCDGTHICSLGYVITASNFHIMKKKDIIINPEKKFNLGSKNNKRTIKLCYPDNIFYKQKYYPYFHSKIQAILTHPKTMLIGFSINNDFNFINLACERYGIPQVTLQGFDVQKLHKILSKDTCVRALDKVAEYYNISLDNLTLHKSCDDAELTMKVLRAICRKEHLTIRQIIEKYPNCITKSKFYIRKKPINTIETQKVASETV